MGIMKCNNCGFENKDTAKFCTRCGKAVDAPVPESKDNSSSKLIIVGLLIVIVILAMAIGYLALNGNNASTPASTLDDSQDEVVNSSSSAPQQTTSQVSQPKDWVLIGSYSGSGTGSETINVPAGQIMVKISAFPIKNYATNYLHVSGSNGQYAGVDWGSTSAVETRSDSLTYTSSSPQTFTIEYYETVSWQVDFYAYQ